MTRRLAWLLALPLALAPLSAFAQSDHGDHDHGVARILETRVKPEVIEIHSDDAISWLNYSSQRARVSFDAEVAKSLTCTSKGSFHLDGARLTSKDIQATQFASLCNLAPGEYEYRVDLSPGVGGSGGASPSKSFTGRIVVTQ